MLLHSGITCRERLRADANRPPSSHSKQQAAMHEHDSGLKQPDTAGHRQAEGAACCVQIGFCRQLMLRRAEQ